MSRIPCTRGLALGAALLLVPGLVAGTLHAQAGVEGTLDSAEFETYVLASGTSIQGKVLSLKGDEVELLARQAGAQSTVTWPLSKFTKISQYNIRRSQLEDSDVDGHMALASWTIEQKLFRQTRAQLQGVAHVVRESEMGESDRAQVRERILGVIETALKAMVDDGKLNQARADLRRLLLRNEAVIPDQWRERLHNAVENTAAKKKAEVKEAKAAKKTAKEAAARQKEFETFEKYLSEGQALRKKALVDTKNSGQQQRLLDRAVQYFERAGKEVEGLRKKFANDKELSSELDERVEEGTTWWKDALLGSASIDVQRASFNKATRKVNRILAHSPRDEQALQMRGRIEIAANEWGRWR